ncbi:hypothetical protein ACFQ0B_66760 [Nonomuraea thailandensis]
MDGLGLGNGDFQVGSTIGLRPGVLVPGDRTTWNITGRLRKLAFHVAWTLLLMN